MSESKDMPNTGICAPGWEPPFITECCFCGADVELVKDQTEGKAFHGDCYSKWKEGK